MNVERLSRLLPACSDRWLPPIVSEAFSVESLFLTKSSASCCGSKPAPQGTRLMASRNPFLWALCGLMVLVFAYCFFIGAMNQ